MLIPLFQKKTLTIAVATLAMEGEQDQGINATMGVEAPSVKFANMLRKLDDMPTVKKLWTDEGSSSAPSNCSIGQLKQLEFDSQPSVASLS